MFPAQPLFIGKLESFFANKTDILALLIGRNVENELFFVFFSAFMDGHLLSFSETHIDVFECISGDWGQTLNLKKVLSISL